MGWPTLRLPTRGNSWSARCSRVWRRHRKPPGSGAVEPPAQTRQPTLQNNFWFSQKGNTSGFRLSHGNKRDLLDILCLNIEILLQSRSSGKMTFEKRSVKILDLFGVLHLTHIDGRRDDIREIHIRLL